MSVELAGRLVLAVTPLADEHPLPPQAVVVLVGGIGGLVGAAHAALLAGDGARGQDGRLLLLLLW